MGIFHSEQLQLLTFEMDLMIFHVSTLSTPIMVPCLLSFFISPYTLSFSTTSLPLELFINALLISLLSAD